MGGEEDSSCGVSMTVDLQGDQAPFFAHPGRKRESQTSTARTHSEVQVSKTAQDIEKG